MAFKFFATFVLVTMAATSAIAQTDLTQCDFVFIPDTPVGPDPGFSLAGDFNFSESNLSKPSRE